MLCLPIKLNDKTIAVLQLINKKAKDGKFTIFSDPDISLLQAFATYAAAALNNSQLYQLSEVCVCVAVCILSLGVRAPTPPPFLFSIRCLQGTPPLAVPKGWQVSKLMAAVFLQLRSEFFSCTCDKSSHGALNLRSC